MDGVTVSVMEWMDSWWALLDEGVDGVSAHSERDGVGGCCRSKCEVVDGVCLGGWGHSECDGVDGLLVGIIG